jgi:Glycosyl hydrolases family 32 N-terminal domain
MDGRFDPYYKWLGIPPSQQPPHHYRLLGVEVFESDREVIDSAANQRMTYLQELAGGDHIKESQQLLNAIAAARRCLLNPRQKSAYDAELRTRLAAHAAASSDVDFAELTDALTPNSTSPPRPAAHVGARPAVRRRKAPILVIGTMAAVVVLAGIAVLAVALAGNRGREKTPVTLPALVKSVSPASPNAEARPPVARKKVLDLPPSVPTKPIATAPVAPASYFSPQNQVLADPCELLFHQGHYHLFYVQHAAAAPAKRGWGHAVSTDLATWLEQPAPFPAELEGALDVGSVVVDLENSSKFATGQQAPWVAIYTNVYSAATGATKSRQTIGLAYSLDEGHTWKKYANNPVIEDYKPGYRHPRVFWHKETRHWVMVLFLGVAKPASPIGLMAIFTSPNLREWTSQSEFDFPGGHECPELCELPLESDQTQSKWCLLARNGRFHFVNFDGAKVALDPRNFGVLDRGLNLVSPRVSRLPDGRRLLIGIAQTENHLTLPAQIQAGRTANGAFFPKVAAPAKPAGTANSN